LTAPSKPAEAFGARCGRRDIGHVRVGDRNIGLHRAAHESHDDQHRKRRRQTGEDKREREAAKTDEQDGPAAISIRQGAEYWRAEKIREAECERHDAVPERLVALRFGKTADQRG
jgi:hypothetical protein